MSLRNGRIAISGRFSETLEIDSSTILEVSPNDASHGFIILTDNNLNLIWHKQMTGFIVESYGICIDMESNVLVSGHFRNYADLDPNDGILNAIATNSDRMFLIKLDNQGSLLWSQGMENLVLYNGGMICVDDQNNIYQAADFYESVTIDPEGINETFENPLSDGIVLIKMDENGEYFWGRQFWIDYSSVGIDPLDFYENGDFIITGVASEFSQSNPPSEFEGALAPGSFTIKISQDLCSLLTFQTGSEYFQCEPIGLVYCQMLNGTSP